MPNRDPVFGDGSSMIPFEVIRFLPDDVFVSLLTFPGEVDTPAEIHERCQTVTILTGRRHEFAQARSLVTRLHSGAAQRNTAAVRSLVRRASAGADATLLHGPHVVPLASVTVGPTVLQTVDPWSMRTDMDRQLATGWRARFRAHKARQAERVERAIPTHVRLLTVSPRDAQRWSERLSRSVRGIPNGVTMRPRPARRPGPPRICFVGSLNYGPNIDSARILVREIGPLVWRSHPEAEIIIAGRRPAAEVLELAGDRVRVMPNVPSVAEIFLDADVAVFPDAHGVGIRNSVGEALGCAVPVVATAAAAREQPPHPLLTVRSDVLDLVTVIDDLLQVHTPGSTQPMAIDERSWRDVALDYLEELQEAIAQGGPSAKPRFVRR
jgi:glycosyltransferase involved in cell wall biosynthesis